MKGAVQVRPLLSIQLHRESLVQPGRHKSAARSHTVMQQCMDIFMAQNMGEPSDIRGGALCRDLNAAEHRMEQPVRPCRAACCTLERVSRVEHDGDGF